MVTKSRYIAHFSIHSNDIANGSITYSDLGTIYTTNVIEGANLYFSNDRVYANVVTLDYATQSFVGNAIANLVSSAPGTLDTLNELALALGNDNAFSTTVINLIATKANASVVDALTTANIPESGNLYFTNARARAAISVAGSGSYDEASGVITVTGGVASVNGANGTVVLTTANIAESGNLYFTNARARAAITAGNTLVYAEATGNITLSTSGVTAGTYGGATQAAALVVDKFGRITSASNVAISGGSGSPGGSSGQIQYNSSGTFAGSANLFWDNTNGRLSVGGNTSPDARMQISSTSKAVLVGTQNVLTPLYSSYLTGQANIPVEISSNAGANNGSADLVLTNSQTASSVNLGSVRWGSSGTSNARKDAASINVTTTASIATSLASALAMIFTLNNSGSGTSEVMRIGTNTDGSATLAIGTTTTSGAGNPSRLRIEGTVWGGGNGSGITGTSTNPSILISGLGLDNSGSVNPVAIQISGGGSGVPRGFMLGSYGRGRTTSSDAVFFLTNTGGSPYSTGLGAPTAGVYRGPLDSTTYAPSSWATYLGNGGMTSFGVYDNYTGDYDGTSKAGIQVRLAGTYGGGNPIAWGGYCYTAYINTNFGAGSNGTNVGYFADITNAGSGSNWGLYINNGGAAKPGGGSFTATSDIRVKNVLGNYTRGLQEVISLIPVNFTYNGKGGHANDGKTYTGLIAQEIQSVFPEMISARKDKLEETDEDPTDILMVDNSSLIYALVNSIKEQQVQIANLTARLSSLEG